MSFRRGAALTTGATLGHSSTGDRDPSPGNGFSTRWHDDLTALRDLGITEVRISLDWARLQPKPGPLDPEWTDWFEQVVRGANSIGVHPWACLHEASIPRWFDNDGGFGDAETFTAWWPRWVERAAERFGDLVAGWVPFAAVPPGGGERPWTDTWGILAGGPPVVASVDLRTEAATVMDYAGRTDMVGAVLVGDWSDDEDLTPRQVEHVADRWGGEIREAAGAFDATLVVPGFDAEHRHADVAGDIVSALRSMLDDAVTDGVPIAAAFVQPGIAGPGSPTGLLDADRAPTPSSAAFFD